MSIKNVILINDFGTLNGGVAFVALSSAVGLVKAGVNVTLLTATPPADSSLADAGVNVVCTHQNDILSEPNRLKAAAYGIYNPVAAKTLSDILSSLSPKDTVVHVHGWMKSLSPSIFRATKKWGGRVFLTNHDFFSVCPNGGLFNYQTHKACHLKAGSLRCALCNCDSRSYAQKIWRFIRAKVQDHLLWQNDLHNIVISKASSDLLAPYFCEHKLSATRVDNPVDIATSGCMANVKDNSYFMFLGRLSKEKGADMFCEAVTQLGVLGIVVGEGPLSSSLRDKYTSINFTGWKNGAEKEDLLCGAKALVLPSIWNETFGLVVTEAMSRGIPCIVPAKTAPAENIIDGKTGFLFKQGDLESLKETIRKAASTDLSVMQSEIQSSFTPERWSLTTHVTNLLKLYNS